MSNTFISGFSSKGNTLLRIIFSTIRGTVMMSAGCTSANALRIIFGLGSLVRKKQWHPWQKGFSISMVMPYMWAKGSMLTILTPGFSIDRLSRQKRTLLQRLRKGTITPLDMPVEPDV